MIRESQEYGEVTDIDPLIETAQGGDRDDESGGSDFGGETEPLQAPLSSNLYLL